MPSVLSSLGDAILLNWEDEFCSSLYTNIFFLGEIFQDFLMHLSVYRVNQFFQVSKKRILHFSCEEVYYSPPSSCPASVVFNPVKYIDCGQYFLCDYEMGNKFA